MFGGADLFLRAALMEKCSESLRGLGKLFGRYDTDRSQELSYQEFKKGLYELCPDSDALETLFDSMDKDESGTVSVTEFFEELLSMAFKNETRAELVEKAWKAADKNSNNVLTYKEMMPMIHGIMEKFKCGEMTEEDAFLELCRFNDPKILITDKAFTKQEFKDYYASRSAKIDCDHEFEHLVADTWLHC